MHSSRPLAGGRVITLLGAVLLGCGLSLVALGSLTAGAVQAAPAVSGTATVVMYTSSVDSSLLNYSEYLPAGYSPTVPDPVASVAGIVMMGAWPRAANLSVTRDGAGLPAGAYAVTGGTFTLLRQPITLDHTYVISAAADAFVKVYVPLVLR